MFDSHLTQGQQAAVALGLALGAASMVCHVRGKDKAALLIMIGAALVMRLFFALLDPYLNQWDESIHAVVAKNMMSDPFKPMLYREKAMVLPWGDWTAKHIWLHKQPFFLWLMAGSMKVLGVNVFSVRMPAVLLSTALVYFTHGIGSALHGRSVGYLSALLTTYASWPLEFVAGFTSTDHNDAVFAALVGGSLWAWYTYRDRPGPRVVVLVGIFVGCAMLTKWLTGLLVFAGWAAVIIAYGDNRANEAKRMLKALALALLIALPWQLYCWLRFPAEMADEMTYNMRHFSHAVEGHEGTSGFYFQLMPEMFFPFEQYTLCIMALLALLLIRNKALRLHAMVSAIGFVAFFTLAATKMPGFLMPVFPYFFVGIAFWIHRTCGAAVQARVGAWLSMAVAGFIAVTMINLERLQIRHTGMCVRDEYFAKYRPARLHNRESLAELGTLLAGRRAAVCNVPWPENLSFSFHYGHEAMARMPEAGMCEQLRASGYEVIVVDPPLDTGVLPSFVHIVRLNHPFERVP